jgi:hypothetical protein
VAKAAATGRPSLAYTSPVDFERMCAEEELDSSSTRPWSGIADPARRTGKRQALPLKSYGIHCGRMLGPAEAVKVSDALR